MSLSARESQWVVQRVLEARDLPTLSRVLVHLRRLVFDPRSSARQVADALRRDQVLSAKLLRLVNSSFYARTAPITSVRHALQFVGNDTLATLLLVTDFLPDASRENPSFDSRGFWRHSLATALLSESIAISAGLEDTETHFTCGLLHDIGKLALHGVSSEISNAVVELAFGECLSYLEAEQRLGLPGHTLLGERLAESWGLPSVIRKAIRYHHRDISPITLSPLCTLEPAAQLAIMTTSLANAAVNCAEIGFSGDPKREALHAGYLARLRITTGSLEALMEKLHDDLRAIEAEIDAAARTRVAA